jgi:glycosyltransferase involved in cell wall biosynthesis
MPRLLLVSYVFPPQGGSGPLRRVKLIRHLHDLGWDVTVLTANAVFTRQIDLQMQAELPAGTSVVRAQSFELSSLNPLVSKLRRLRRSDATSAPEDGVVPSTSLPTRIARAIQRWLFVPDREIGWAPAALRAGHKILDEWQPEVIVSFSYPFTCHLVGRTLARSGNIPFVTNFSDLWVGNRILYDVLPTPVHRAVARRLERAVIRSADVNVVITDGMRTEFGRRYPSLGADRWAVAYNGFDPLDVPSVAPPADDGPFTLVYTGLAFTDRNSSNDPRPLLRGLADLLARRRDLTGQVQLDIYGTTDGLVANQIDELGLRPTVRLHDHVPYREAIDAIARSDAAVLLMTDALAASTVLPTKVFDYLGLGRPILAIAFEGETTRFARFGSRTIVASPTDPVAIAEGIERLIALRPTPLESASGPGAAFTRAATAMAFDGALRRAIAIHGARELERR